MSRFWSVLWKSTWYFSFNLMMAAQFSPAPSKPKEEPFSRSRSPLIDEEAL
jgi:hypothetical protein